ncbi:MAG: hypothetical protein SGILL_003790, partial [Bacillariaceae sp.]
KIYPEKRFGANWENLDEDTRADARTLYYGWKKWDLVERSARESYLSYEEAILDMTKDQKKALDNLVANAESWDCYINHYDSYGWTDIESDETLLSAFVALGYTESWWDGSATLAPTLDGRQFSWQASFFGEETPLEAYDKYWDDLTDEEKDAAKTLCYDANTWDGIPMSLWVWPDVTSSAPGGSPSTNPPNAPSAGTDEGAATTSPSHSPIAAASPAPSAVPSMRTEEAASLPSGSPSATEEEEDEKNDKEDKEDDNKDKEGDDAEVQTDVPLF